MKVVGEDVDISTLIISPEQALPRSAGVHVSAIINYLAVQLGRRDNDFSRSDLDRFALLGRLFEVILAATMFPAPRYERLGELEVDGIIGSPDVFDTSDGSVVEIKVSWKSAKHDIQTFREYWYQLMSYAYMVNTRVGQLVVLHVNGNYSPPVPILRRYRAEFTWAELKQNWAMLQNNKGAIT